MRSSSGIAIALLGMLLAVPASAGAQSTGDESAGLVEVPAGTRVIVRTVVQIDTEMDVGRVIAVRLADDVSADGEVLVPAGGRGVGEVIAATAAGESGELEVAFRLASLRIDGRSVPVSSRAAGVSVVDGSVRQVGPGEVVAGSGGGIELRDDGRRLVIRSGTKVVFQLDEPAAVPAP